MQIKEKHIALNITSSDLEYLKIINRKRNAKVYEVFRANIILLAAKGFSKKQIAM